MRVLGSIVIVGMLAGCAPDFSTPTSPLQWERRQQAIERREAERLRVCPTLRPMSREWLRQQCNQSRETDKDICSGAVTVIGGAIREQYADGSCRIQYNDLG